MKLDRETATLTVGETLKLTATVYPANAKNKNVSWRSEDEKTGTVSSDGTVTALSPGKLYIVCTTEDQEKWASCLIDVVAPVIKVTGVSFGISEITVNEGDTFPLTPVFKPADATEKGVSWKCDDTAVATVDNEGVVTAVKTGTTTVSCTTKDGGFVAKCTVRVIKKGNYQVFFGGSETPSSITYKLGSTEDDILRFRMFDKGTSSFVGGEDIEVTSSENNVAVLSGHDDESCLVKAVGEGTVTLTFSFKGNTINSVILNVLPKPEYGVFATSVQEENEVLEGSIRRINTFPKNWSLLLYDKANDSNVDGTNIKTSGESSDETVAKVSPNDRGEVHWTIYAKGAGSSTITLKFGDFTRTFDLVVTYLSIYFDGKPYQSGSSSYKMGTNQNDLVKVQLLDQVTKTFVNGKYVKVIPTDPTVGVVDSYTDDACLIRIKKTGMIILLCYDTSAGVDCLIDVARISISK